MIEAGRDRALLLVSLAASAVLVAVYLAAGGASYAPAKTQDPCAPREWRNPEGLQGIAEQFSLSALDGAACQLGVTRETLARALVSEQSRQRFLNQYDVTDEELARAVQSGLLRAVRDAEEAGAISPLLGVPLRTAIRSVPLDEAIELVQDASKLLDRAQSLLGPAESLVSPFLP